MQTRSSLAISSSCKRVRRERVSRNRDRVSRERGTLSHDEQRRSQSAVSVSRGRRVGTTHSTQPCSRARAAVGRLGGDACSRESSRDLNRPNVATGALPIVPPPSEMVAAVALSLLASAAPHAVARFALDLGLVLVSRPMVLAEYGCVGHAHEVASSGPRETRDVTPGPHAIASRLEGAHCRRTTESRPRRRARCTTLQTLRAAADCRLPRSDRWSPCRRRSPHRERLATSIAAAVLLERVSRIRARCCRLVERWPRGPTVALETGSGEAQSQAPRARHRGGLGQAARSVGPCRGKTAERLGLRKPEHGAGRQDGLKRPTTPRQPEPRASPRISRL